MKHTINGRYIANANCSCKISYYRKFGTISMNIIFIVEVNTANAVSPTLKCKCKFIFQLFKKTLGIID